MPAPLNGAIRPAAVVVGLTRAAAVLVTRVAVVLPTRAVVVLATRAAVVHLVEISGAAVRPIAGKNQLDVRNDAGVEAFTSLEGPRNDALDSP